MMSTFFYFQPTLNRLLNNSIKLYCSSSKMKGAQVDPPATHHTHTHTHTHKVLLKSLVLPSLTRVNETQKV